MGLADFPGAWIRSALGDVVVRRKSLARRNRFPAVEMLEDRTLLSSTNAVAADSFTVVDTGTSGQLSVLHNTDWDAQAAAEWVALFAGQRITQTAGINQTFLADDYVAVDVNKTYGLSGWARSSDNFGMRFSSLNQQSFGIEEYDADYLKIEAVNVLKYGAAGDTTLQADLKPGDTQILLNSVTGWSTSTIAGTRALAWYGYTNSAGTTYANYTYTRNVATGGAAGLWSASGINLATKTITLNAPWSGPLISAGTAVRNATTGSDHSTIALNRSPVAGDFSPTEQVAVIGGGTSVNGAYAAGRFSPGTAFVRPIVQANQHGQTNNFITWQDVRVLELPAGSTLQDARLPTVDLSVNTPGDQTVTLPLYSTSDQLNPIATEARIKVAQNQQYRLTVDALDMSEQDSQPVGFYSYDADGKLIHSLHVTKFAAATDTHLARAVSPGDTAIYVTDATGWSDAIGGTAESRSIAWFGYRDSSGTLYPDYTYTRNVAFDFRDGLWSVGGITFDSGVGAWKINLRSAWTGPAITSGTAVRNATGHDAIQLLSIPTDRHYHPDIYTYPYDTFVPQTDNQDWFQYAATIGGGVWQNGSPTETSFRPGTAYVQPAVKALLADQYAVHFGLEADRALVPQSHQATFGDSTSATLNRSRQVIESDVLVPVSAALPVTISSEVAFGTALGTNQVAAEKLSMGYVPYDADGQVIASLNVARYATAVDTTLAMTLNPGDTQITLTNSSGWSNIDVAGTRALAWYGYRDLTGTLYPNYSYTRNIAADIVNGLWNPGGISGNVITLRQPWAGPTLVAGTAVRNAVDGDNMIPAMANETTIANQWTKLSVTLSGTWTNGIRNLAALPPGTASLRIVARANEVNFAADDTIRIRNAQVTTSSASQGSLQSNNVTIVNLDVLSNDAVASGNVQITTVGSAKFGTVRILTGAGIGGRDVVEYTSQAWFAGTDQFTYTVRNISTNETWSTTASVTVTANNIGADPSLQSAIMAQANTPASHAAPPVSRKPENPLWNQMSLYGVEQGQTLVADDLPMPSLRNTATDAESDVLSYQLVSGVSHGTLTLRADGTFEYTPQSGFTGNDSFEYLVTDGLSSLTRRAGIHVSAPDVTLLASRMRDLVFAFHNQHDIYNAFSIPAYLNQSVPHDPDGNPYLSWRVYLLPRLGYAELFAKFHLDEPWNSANNLPLLSQMPNVFRSLGDLPSITSTRFQTISDLQDLGGYSSATKHYLLRNNGYGTEFASLRDFSDDWSHTILFLQTGADAAVPWTAPLDVDHDPANPFAQLGTLPDGRINMAMASGSLVSLATSDIGTQGFDALVTLSGDELIDVPTLAHRDDELNPGTHLGYRSWSILGLGARQAPMQQRLKTIGLAMHNYYDTYSEFPNGRYYQYYPNGKPYFSWRVYLLPYLGYSNLFNQFNFNEPWDSPHNLTLLDQMPEVFRSDGDLSSSTTTRLQVLSGPDALYFGKTATDPTFRYVGPQIQDILDGTSNTILVAELGKDRATPWTAPDEIVFDAANPMAAFGELSGGETRLLMADGSVLEMGNDLLARNVIALASPRGFEPLDGSGLLRMEADRSESVIDSYREPIQIKNQLKQMGLAFHNYHDVFNRFPVENNWHYFGPDARPYLSWRVHLLPYMEQSALYWQFHLDEPWDSPHNIQLLDKMPQIYRSIGDAADSTTTRMQVFTGPDALFERVATGNYNGPTYLGPRISSITDGTSNTILAVEAGQSMAVPWTKPDDLAFDPNDPLGTMGLRSDDVFTALLADGSVRQISASTIQSVLKAFITPSGNEYVYDNYGRLVNSPQGNIRPGVSLAGVTDTRLVISEGHLGAIDVVLDKPGNVTIDITLSVGGVALADKATLTFTTANWNVPQTVTLQAIDDDLINVARSTVLTLSVNDATTTTDEFDALADIVIPVFNVNDDVPGIVTTGGSAITVTEGAAGQVVSVSLSHRPSSNVTVSVTSADSTQATVSIANLVFTPVNWNTPQSVTVTAVNDVIADATVETSVRFHVTSSTDLAFKGLPDIFTAVTVLDNEVPGFVVTITGSDTVVSEDGLTDTITVKLAVKPAGDVIVNVLPLDGTEVSVSILQLTFTPANWNTPQTIIVSGVNDALSDGDQFSDVQFSVAAQSSQPYLTAASKMAVVTTRDNELARPVIVTPPASTVSQQPVITWTGVANAVQYQVWISKNSASQNPVVNNSVMSTSLTPSLPLGIDNWTVWVRAIGPGDQLSFWSDPRKFLINTPPVLDALPQDVRTERPTFSWTAVPGAVTYDLWVNNLSTGQTQVIRNVSLTGTSFTPPTPLPLGAYSAWLRAIDATGTAALWSIPMSFRISTAPQLIGPLNPTSSLQPTFSWTAVSGAVTYDLWVNNRSTGQTQVIRKSAVTGTSFTPTTPLPLGSYSAWVRAFDARGSASFWSAEKVFYVAAAPQLIALQTPTLNPRPQFNWQSVPGATRYELFLHDVSKGIDKLYSVSAGTSWTPASDLSRGLYKWWVRAKGVGDVVGFWSSESNFDVGGAPVLTSIPISSDRTPLFQWSPVDGAVRYILQIDRLDVPMSQVVRAETIPVSHFTLTSDLAPGTYRAWVQAVSNTGSFSLWSVPLVFAVTQAEVDPDPAAGLHVALESGLMRSPSEATVELQNFKKVTPPAPSRSDETWLLDEFFFDPDLDFAGVTEDEWSDASATKSERPAFT